jgi:hypothetical protein
LALLLASACGEGPLARGENAPTDYNVILVTLDGVRWEELFGGMDPMLSPRASPAPLFAEFHRRIAPRGRLYGSPFAHSEMQTATVANASLPGYSSIFAETHQSCLTNFCSRISVPTFLDRLHDELFIPRDELAVFASWPKLSLAVTGRDDVAVVKAGGYDLSGAGEHPERELLEEDFEMDRGTVLEGFDYLARRSPRFLYLSLLDSDRFGHQANYDRYVKVLRAYDRLLVKLVARLDAAGAAGRKTALIITTDHGRGLWDQWSEHGPQTPASSRVWAFAMLPADATELSLEKPDARVFNHHDVRYSIETLFGLSTADHHTGFIRR